MASCDQGTALRRVRRGAQRQLYLVLQAADGPAPPWDCFRMFCLKGEGRRVLWGEVLQLGKLPLNVRAEVMRLVLLKSKFEGVF